MESNQMKWIWLKQK